MVISRDRAPWSVIQSQLVSSKTKQVVFINFYLYISVCMKELEKVRKELKGFAVPQAEQQYELTTSVQPSLHCAKLPFKSSVSLNKGSFVMNSSEFSSMGSQDAESKLSSQLSVQS